MQVLITTLRPIRNNVLDMTSIFLFEVDLIRVIRISNHFTTHFDSTHAHYFPLFLPSLQQVNLKETHKHTQLGQNPLQTSLALSFGPIPFLNLNHHIKYQQIFHLT
jgi:hypothetical protein